MLQPFDRARFLALVRALEPHGLVQVRVTDVTTEPGTAEVVGTLPAGAVDRLHLQAQPPSSAIAPPAGVEAPAPTR